MLNDQLGEGRNYLSRTMCWKELRITSHRLSLPLSIGLHSLQGVRKAGDKSLVTRHTRVSETANGESDQHSNFYTGTPDRSCAVACAAGG